MRGLNVLVLTLLRSAAYHDYERLAIFAEIHAIAWSKVDPAFIDARAHAFHLREITLLDADQRRGNLGRRRSTQAA